MRTKSISSPRIKHVPQRTCVACREVKVKRDLIRLVRIPEGDVEIDTDNKKMGRGAYLCQSRECWEAGLKGNRLDYHLKTTITQDNKNKLIKSVESLLEEQSNCQG